MATPGMTRWKDEQETYASDANAALRLLAPFMLSGGRVPVENITAIVIEPDGEMQVRVKVLYTMPGAGRTFGGTDTDHYVREAITTVTLTDDEVSA